MTPRLTLAFILLTIACNAPQTDPGAFEPVVREEINQMREQFWAAARTGNADSMLSFHLDSSQVYRLYENAEAYDYKAQADGHKAMKEGITRMDFNVQVKDTMVFSQRHTKWYSSHWWKFRCTHDPTGVVINRQEYKIQQN